MEAGGGGGPAPFLMKTYEMVDDSSTDDIVSWSSTNASFVVWNPPEFAAKLLPTYFKHNNFSSFIRQLNTYGFRKIDPERWEFANEDFIKDRKDLLKNIHRRKPIHSHSHPPGSSLPDSERMALEEEIDRLAREKVALSSDLWRFKQQQSGTKIQLEDLHRRLSDMEQRQAKMLAFLDRALRNPTFVENLIKMAGSGTDFSVLHKKRRLPGVDYCLEISDNNNNNNTFYDNGTVNGAAITSKPDAALVFNQDFCDKLKLGLCPAAISDTSNNCLFTASTQGSNEAGGSPTRLEQNRDGSGNGRLECLTLVPDTLEHSDTGTSVCLRNNSMFPGTVDDGDGLVPCHLNLTLASSSMQIDKSHSFSASQDSIPDEAIGDTIGDTNKEVNQNQSSTAGTAKGNSTLLHDAAQATGNQGHPAAAPGRVNDVFWEQFLTERPGYSDTEEASSSLRTYHSDDTQDERPGNDSVRKNRRDMEQLSL